MNSQPEEINVVLCQGRKTDGTQCKAEIQKKSKYCGKCRTKVDPQWFSSTVITCHGQGDDGSICGNIFDDEDEYCTMCATPRPKPVATTELKMHSADTCNREEGSQMVLDPAASLNSGKNSTPVALSSDQKANTDNSHLDNVEKRNDTTSVDNSVDKEEEKRTQKEIIKEEKRTHESDMTAQRVQTELLGAASLAEHVMETVGDKDEMQATKEEMTKTDMTVKLENQRQEIDRHEKADKEKEAGLQDQLKNKITVFARTNREKEDKSVERKKEEGTRKIIQTESNERGKRSEEPEVTVRTKEEALQVRLQKENSNRRRKISANQDTNKYNTLHQGQISNLRNPDCIWLHFHVLVSPDFQWKMGQHKVYIDIDFKSSKITREMEHVKQVQGYEEIQTCILINKQEVLESEFKYIYVIYDQQKGKKKVEKYYKSDWIWTVKYRSCLLPANLVEMNEYHQYDGIMNRYIGTWDRVRKLSKGDPVKKLEDDAKISAEIFTQEKLLSTGYMVDKLDQETLNMLDMLLLGLEKTYLQDAKCWSSSQKEFKAKMATAILSPILKSLESEIQTPLTGYTETQQQAERRMQMALFILTMIGHFKFPLSAQNRSLLAKFLLLRPHHQTGEFHDLAVIAVMPSLEKERLGKYMADFCNSFQMNEKDPSWLFCIPLLHFLSGHVKLDQPPSQDRRRNEDQWWGIQSIKSTVENFRCCTATDWMISLEEIVSCLSPLFDLDYFLPRTLMFALQLNEVEMVIQQKTVPPEVCIVICIHHINKLDSKTFSSPTPELKQIIRTTMTLKEFLAKFEAPGRWDDSLLLQHAYLMQIFADEMVRITFERKPLTFERKHLHDLLREVVQVFLEAMALYDTTNKKLPMKEDVFQYQMLQNVRPKVKKWLSENFSSFTSTDFTDNLKRWQEMLCSKDFMSPFVAEKWNTFLTNDFKKHWENEKAKGFACESTLVEQYCSLVESLHPRMQSCLHDLALKVIPASYQISMQTLGVSERGHFGRLLSQWYEKEWEVAMVQKDMEEDRMILHHILKWMPFSCFLEMFSGSKDKLKDGHKKELECDSNLPPKSVHKQMTVSNKEKENKGKNAIQASKVKTKKRCEGSDIILSTGKNAIQASKLERKRRGDGCVEKAKKEKPMTGYKQKDKSVKTLAAKRTFKEMLRGVVDDDFNRYSSEPSVKPYRFMNVSDSAAASSIDVQSQIDVLTAERDEARLRVADLEHQVKDLQLQLEVGRKLAPPVVTPSKVDFLQRTVEFIGSRTDANTSFDYTLLKSNTRRCLEQQLQSKETYSQQSVQLFPSQQTNIDDHQQSSSFQQLLQLTPDKQASTDELKSTHKQLTFTDQSIQQQILTQSSHQQPMQQMHYQRMSAQLAQHTSTPKLQLNSQSLQQFAFEKPIEISRSTEQPWIQEQYFDWQQDYQHEYQQKDTNNYFQHNRSLNVNNYCPDIEESVVPASAVDEERSSPVAKFGDRKVPLVDGAEVYISKQQKSSLAIRGFHQPRKVKIHILDTLFDQKRLAGMSALGSRSAPNKKAGPMT